MGSQIIAIAFILAGYLVGSISFGLIIGKAVKKIDIRHYGSGSTGATNVARTCGPIYGAIVLLLDMAKAILPLIFAIHVINTPIWSHSFIGLSAIVGHVWPLYTRFRGGKGIASGWAALTILCPWAGLLATLAGVPLIIIFRYVSLGSICGSIFGTTSLVIFCFISPLPLIDSVPYTYSIFGIFGGIITVILHRQNILRLIEGKEKKIGQRSEDISS